MVLGRSKTLLLPVLRHIPCENPEMRLVRVLLLVIALGIFYFLLYRQTHPKEQTAPTAAAGSGLEFQIHSVSVTNNLDLGDFVIPAKETHDVPIIVDETQMRNAR